jgi:hypothetical protein
MPILSESLGQKALQIKQSQDQLASSMAPTAVKMFSKRALNALVKSFNALAPVYGLMETYPEFTADAKTLPNDFVKYLIMVGQSTRDAVAQDIIDPELIVSLDGIKDDKGILRMSAQLDGLRKDRGFKAFLTEAPDYEAEDTAEAEQPIEEAAPAEAPEEDELMSLLSARESNRAKAMI